MPADFDFEARTASAFGVVAEVLAPPALRADVAAELARAGAKDQGG